MLRIVVMFILERDAIPHCGAGFQACTLTPLPSGEGWGEGELRALHRHEISQDLMSLLLYIGRLLLRRFLFPSF